KEQVIVSASRTQLRLSEAPGSTVSLSEKDVASTPALTVDDMLRQVPGFALFRRSGSRTANPTSQGVSLRGLGASGPAALWFLRMAFRLATRLGDGFTGAAFQKPKWPAWKFFAEEVQTCTVAMRLAASCNLFRADPKLRRCHWRRPTAMNALQTSPSGPVPPGGRGIFKWLLICSTPTGTSLFRLLFKAAWTSRRIQSMLPWTQPLATNLAARDESSAAPAISTKLGKMG